MLELKNVSKYYNANGITNLGLRNINLKLHRNEIVAITGDSGSGKSTLLNVLSKIDSFDEGEIYYRGNETSYFSINDMDDFRKNKVGFIFQNYNIIDSYTVLENVMVPLLLKGKSRREAKEEAKHYLEKVGLSKKLKNRGSKLSGGEKQRCVIARALASDCEILACDEPTGNLDSKTGEEIINLLKEVSKVEGLKRIRFMTPHPKDLSDELIEVMATTDKICHHVHLPLQSGSSRILEKMNRHYTKESYLELVRKIRTRMPDAALTTDIIVGFPGETEEDFNDTMDVVREAEFDSAFTFIYSKREGTPAASREDQIPEEITKERFDRLLKLVGDVAKKRCGKDVGKTLKVLVEEVNETHPELVTGRLENNTLVHFKGDKSLIGELVDVKLNESKGFYYIGEQV